MFGIPYESAVVIVGVVMLAYVLFGGMIATTWVQIIKAVLLLGGVTRAGRARARAVRLQPGPSSTRRWRRRTARRALEPGGLVTDPARRRVARPGADARPAGPAAHPDALLHGAGREGGAHVGAVRDRLHRLLLPHHPDRRLRRLGARRPRRDRRDRQGRQHGRAARGRAARRHAVPRLHRRGRVRDHPRRRRRPDAGRRDARSPTTSSCTWCKKGNATEDGAGPRRARWPRSSSAPSRCCSASSSRARTSRSWSASPSRSRAARTSRRCCSRSSGAGSRPPARSASIVTGALLVGRAHRPEPDRLGGHPEERRARIFPLRNPAIVSMTAAFLAGIVGLARDAASRAPRRCSTTRSCGPTWASARNDAIPRAFVRPCPRNLP